jgi:hypothetical protein
MNLAEWAARCNLEKKCAVTSAQLQARRASLRVAGQCPDDTVDDTPTYRRYVRRKLRLWRKRWGFRLGKLRLRDHFAAGELLGKAAVGDSFCARFDKIVV